MKDKEYWRRRSKEYEAALLTKCKEELEPELKKLFRESLSAIEKDIESLYGRYQAATGLSYAEARKLLRGAEYSKWRLSLKEYVALSHTDSKILKELQTLSMRSRISRLEELYTDTLKELQKLGEQYEGVVKDFLTTAYKERYYHGIYDLSKVGKLEIPVTKVQPEKLENVLAQKWAGGNYSSRIWKNTEKLSQVLKSTLSQGLHRGLSVQKLSRELSKEMKVSYKNAERLVRTELNFVQNHAAKESLEAAGLEEYEFIAVLDHRTSQRCQALDGTVHLLEEYDVGTNAPPMHPRCRSTISAVIEGGTRTAKTGKNIKVPAEMKYGDYKRVYVEKKATSLKDGSRIVPNNGVKITHEQVFSSDKITIDIKGIGAAVIPTAKLTKYALNPEKDANKARAFELALGYTLSNVEKLIENIAEHINEYELIEKPDNGYGKRFQVVMELIGENGKTAKVLLAWLLDKNTGEFRLTTIHVDK